MREIDEVHEAKGYGEPACQHEQEHAVRDAVEKDGQHGLLQEVAERRSFFNEPSTQCSIRSTRREEEAGSGLEQWSSARPIRRVNGNAACDDA
jgi:hypothetical protein